MESKRKWKELKAMYLLEPEIIDIFVEGVSDKAIITNYLSSIECTAKVISIDDVDLSDVDETFKQELSLSSNRDRVVIMSRVLSSLRKKSRSMCVIDRDLDDYLPTPLATNDSLLLTDFACMESYFFNTKILEKFIIHNFADFKIQTSVIIQNFSKVLKEYFCLRICRKNLFDSAKLIDLHTEIVIDKVTGEIRLDINSLINKVINKNNLSKKADLIHQKFKLELSRIGNDCKYSMNGHDFFQLFFHYLLKIKNKKVFNDIESFGKAMRMVMEAAWLAEYPLFKTIEETVSKNGR